MSKAYLCPHCRARNRFDASASAEGVVRCGACGKAFMLPDYAGAASSRLDTAVIDTRAEQQLARDSAAKDTTAKDTTVKDTAVVDTRREPGPGPRIGAVDHVAGSNVPTLLVYDDPPERRGSETPTVIGFDALEASNRALDPSGLDRQGASGVEVSHSALERPTRVDAPAWTRDRRPSDASEDTLVEQLRVPDYEPPPERHAAETVPAGDVPPVPSLESESPRSTARTQPTAPPPEYLARIREKPPEPALAGTQPAEIRTDPLGVLTRVGAVLGLCALVGGAFYYASSRVEGTLEAGGIQSTLDSAMGRSTLVVDAIGEAMLAGRPDVARRLANGLDDAIQVVRPDGSRAFTGDWSTYRVVLGKVCGAGEDGPRSGTGPAAAAAWRGGADPRVAGLGPDPCAARDSLPTTNGAVDPALAGRLADSAGGSGRAWVQERAGRRTQVVLHPIERRSPCVSCHAEGRGPLGYVVVRSGLASVDAAVSDARSVLRWTGIAAALLAGLALLCLLHVVTRQGGPFGP